MDSHEDVWWIFVDLTRECHRQVYQASPQKDGSFVLSWADRGAFRIRYYQVNEIFGDRQMRSPFGWREMTGKNFIAMARQAISSSVLMQQQRIKAKAFTRSCVVCERSMEDHEAFYSLRVCPTGPGRFCKHCGKTVMEHKGPRAEQVCADGHPMMTAHPLTPFTSLDKPFIVPKTTDFGYIKQELMTSLADPNLESGLRNYRQQQLRNADRFKSSVDLFGL